MPHSADDGASRWPSTIGDWHARELLQAFAATRRDGGRHPPRRLSISTAARHGMNLPASTARCRMRCWCAPFRRQLRGGDAAARRAARAGSPGRAGVERRARHRTLRGQVDDELSASPAPACRRRRPGRSRARRRHARSPSAKRRRDLGDEAAVRVAGEGPAADHAPGRIAGAGERLRASIICNAITHGHGGVPRSPSVRLRGRGRRGDDPPCGLLGHQSAARRPGRGVRAGAGPR